MITRIQQLLSGCVLSRLYVFWSGDTIFSFEQAQDDSDGWQLWDNRAPKDHKPFLEMTFRTLEELEAYEYMPGQTLADIWQPEMLYSIEQKNIVAK